MEIFMIIISYLFGSLSLGQIHAKNRNMKLNKIGTKNPGAYNVYHEVGPNWGIISGAFDVFKGTLPVYIAKVILNYDFSFIVMVVTAAVVGHMWPLFFKFRGGRGLATTVGTLLVIDFYLALFILVIAALLTFWIRDLTDLKPRVSLLLCPLFILGGYYFRSSTELMILGFVVTIIVYIKAVQFKLIVV